MDELCGEASSMLFGERSALNCKDVGNTYLLQRASVMGFLNSPQVKSIKNKTWRAAKFENETVKAILF